jgi:signal transduction histidine kinase/CheY-like chemotaxis protein
MSVQFCPEVNELLLTNIHESLKNRQWKEVEYYIDLFGVRYFYHSRIVPIDGDKVISLNMEIGDRVRRMNELIAQRQRAEESDRKKNVFIANMSHEIRTPLNAIIGFSGFLMNEKKPEKRQKYMDIVRNSSILLRQIVSDILDLSRLEAGMTEFTFEDTDIIALMNETAEVYMPAMKPGVRLLLEIPDKDLQTPTDDFRVKQILSNFISNAVKYTEKGAITLKVEEDGEYLIFSVADTGCGIPEDKLDAIFDRFEKLNRFVQGTGLGLALCKYVVERLGGKITVTSKVGEGSVFSFNIPYRFVGNIGNMSDDGVHRRKKILLAETSEEDVHFIRENLSKKYDITVVADPEKIINPFILDNPNIVLVSMEFARKQDVIRKIRTVSSVIPIIAMTSSDYYHDQRQAFENGCTDVLAKPFSASKLGEVVMSFMV